MPEDLSDARRVAIFDAMATASEQLGVEIIAEGVETEEQHEVLRKRGIRYAQGFHYSRPIPAPLLLDRLKAEA